MHLMSHYDFFFFNTISKLFFFILSYIEAIHIVLEIFKLWQDADKKVDTTTLQPATCHNFNYFQISIPIKIL